MENKELFKLCLGFILKWEGGYVNDPDDRGGATNMGITQYTLDFYLSKNKKPPKNVKNITQAEVEDIYYCLYWLKSGCEEMNPVFAALCFDTAVNMGVSRVSELLKKADYADSQKFILARIAKYTDFAKKGNQRKFLLGWISRVFDLVNFINERIIKNGNKIL